MNEGGDIATVHVKSFHLSLVGNKFVIITWPFLHGQNENIIMHSGYKVLCILSYD